MSARPSDFLAQDEQAVAPLLYRFARFVIREVRVRVQGPARQIRTATGKTIIYEPEPQVFPGSFKVRLVGAREVVIGPGLVSGTVPKIKEVRIDGLDEDGKELPEGPPRLTVSPPAGGRRSWVVLMAKTDADGELDAKAEVPVEVRSLIELPRNLRDEGEGTVMRIVAEISWTGAETSARITAVRQVVWYDQEVYQVGGKARWRAAS